MTVQLPWRHLPIISHLKCFYSAVHVLHPIVNLFCDLNAPTTVTHPILHLWQSETKSGSVMQQQTAQTAAVMINAGP